MHTNNRNTKRTELDPSSHRDVILDTTDELVYTVQQEKPIVSLRTASSILTGGARKTKYNHSTTILMQLNCHKSQVFLQSAIQTMTGWLAVICGLNINTNLIYSTVLVSKWAMTKLSVKSWMEKQTISETHIYKNKIAATTRKWPRALRTQLSIRQINWQNFVRASGDRLLRGLAVFYLHTTEKILTDENWLPAMYWF